jgi:hypothetical protein
MTSREPTIIGNTLAGALDVSQSDQYASFEDVLKEAHPLTAAILGHFALNSEATNIGERITFEGAEDLFYNLRGSRIWSAGKRNESTALGLVTLARVYQSARVQNSFQTDLLKHHKVIDLQDITVAGALDPLSLHTSNITLTNTGQRSVAKLDAIDEIPLPSFPRMRSLVDLPGKRIAVIGMGGGTDGIQAAMVAKMISQDGKHEAVAVSIRTSKLNSQGYDGTVAAPGMIQNHGGEVSDGVYRMTANTTGGGRFLENLPANDVQIYLIADDEESPVTQKLQSILEDAGDIDTVIGLDTGGDVLFGYPDEDELARSAPDQDVRTLHSITELSGVTKLVGVLAPGIDSPTNAADILYRIGAVYFEPNTKQSAEVLKTYKRWHMDGSDPRYYGKTSLTWQAALRSPVSRGVTTLSLPEKAVITGPRIWDPYIVLQPAMRGAFFIEAERM